MQRQKYQVTRKLDAGGMAEVYEGVAEGLEGFKKKVAIKRVLPHLAENERFIRMFLDEARLSLHLSHANVVQVFDIGQAGNTYFIVMEYVDGTNLKSLMQTFLRHAQRLPVEQCVFIIMEVCRGLSYAHNLKDASGKKLGLVHRDVSPPNILLSRQGEVKIVDFGLAKATSQLEHTEPGVVKGKYAYLSPESAMGQPVDLRMDVFGCGIVLYELLTGQRLFLGRSDLETIQNVRQAHVPDMRSFNRDVPDALNMIVRKALAADVNQRYQSCDALAEALADFLFSERLKVTGFDLKRTLDRTLFQRESPKKDAQSIIDRFIQEELSVFASLDQVGSAIAPERLAGKPKDGAQPLNLSGLESYRPTPTPSAHQAAASVTAPSSVSGQFDPSQPTSPPLATMLEGDPDTWIDPEEAAAEAAEARQNFVMGLTLAMAAVTLIFALAWLFGLFG